MKRFPNPRTESTQTRVGILPVPNLSSTTIPVVGDGLKICHRSASSRGHEHNLRPRDLVYGVFGIVILLALLAYLSGLFVSKFGVLGDTIVGLLLLVVVVIIVAFLIRTSSEYFDHVKETDGPNPTTGAISAPETLAPEDCKKVTAFPTDPEERGRMLRQIREREKEKARRSLGRRF